MGVGSTFLFAGLEKVLRGPEYVVPYFSSLSIAWPEITGPLIGAFELVGGIALVVGVLTRPIAVAFVCEMIVAITTLVPEGMAARSVVDVFHVFRLEALLIWSSSAIAALGPGRWTIVRGFEWLRAKARQAGGGSARTSSGSR